MKWNKQLFLIAASAVLILGVVAAGPVSKPAVTAVGAAPAPIPAEAIITCTAVNSSGGVLGQPIVNNVDFSLGLVIPPANFALYTSGSNCAQALQGLAEIGFERRDSTAVSVTNATFPNGAVTITWTYQLPNEAPLL
jgi:hypothetical protein